MSQDARTLLSEIFAPFVGQPSFVEICGLSKGSNEFDARSFALDDVDWLDNVVARAQYLSENGESVYFGGSPRTVAVSRQHPHNKAEDVCELGALWVDVDPDKAAPDPHWRAKHRDAFAHPRLPPSACVDSGNGYQYWFLLAEPLRDVVVAKQLLKRIVAGMPRSPGATIDEHPTFVSAVMRLPGWPNVKDPARPLATSLEWCRPKLRFTLEEIARAFPEKTPGEKKPSRATRPGEQTSPRSPGVQTVETSARTFTDAERRTFVERMGHNGHRHGTWLAAAGAARKAGWLESEIAAEASVISAMAGDEELEDRLRAIRSTFEQPNLDEVKGWSSLEDLGFTFADLPSISPRGKRARVILGPDEGRVVDEALAVLAADDRVYQRGGLISHIIASPPVSPRGEIARPAGSCFIDAMDRDHVGELLAIGADWIKMLEDGSEKLVRPPEWVAKKLLARKQWSSIRPLEAVVDAPVLRPDGSVLSTPGYDEQTNLFYRGEPLEIPDAPTTKDVYGALDLLLETVRDFPLKVDASRSVVLAAILTPFARFAFDGPVPLFLFDASSPGSGKTLLANAIGTMLTGRDLATIAFAEDEDEMRKRITAIALEGDGLVLIDNIGEGMRLKSPSLDAALTSNVWKDRILGKSAMTRNIPMNAIWFATGNNVALGGDVVRRTLPIRLECDVERPETRSDFAHPNLKAWIRSQRPTLMRAAVTVLRAYCAAGRPPQKLDVFGSFEGWSSLVRAALVWAGMPDPCLARADLSMTDTTLALRRRLIAGWLELSAEGKGWTAAAAIRRVQDAPVMELELLRDVFHELAGEKTLTSRALGYELRKIKGRVFAFEEQQHAGQPLLVRRAFHAEVNRDGVVAWSVRPVGDAPGDASGTGAASDRPEVSDAT